MAITGSKPNKVTVDGTTVTIKAGSGIPGVKGDTGSQGPAGTAATVTVGTTTTGAPGSDASVVNSGTSSAAVLEFTVPRGAAGAAGAAATITVGSTTTGTAGSTAVVTNSGTSSAAVLDFTIPRGDTGTAATVTVGSTTTGTAGSTAIVTNSGTSSAAVLNFTIPRGDAGTNGAGVVAGGTTGQALVKASGSDYDTTWATQIPASLLDAKGDLIVASAADTAARLAVGTTNGQVLTADSTATNGLAWSLPNQASNSLGSYNTTTGTSRAYSPPGITGTANLTASAAQTARWWVFRTEKTVEVKRIHAWVQTLEAGATLRLGIYSVNTNLEPTTLIADYGTVDCSSTGRKSASGTTTVIGLFAICGWSSNHSTVRYIRANTSLYFDLFGDGAFLDSNGQVCWGINSVDYSSGLPANAPTPHTQMTLQTLGNNTIFLPGVTLG